MNIALSLLVLTVLMLVGGAAWLWRHGGPRKQIALMLVLAVVLAANVAIWALPGKSGKTLMDATPQ